MLIVDVEATGVDAKLCSLLSVGAIDFDNPKNEFYMECRAFAGAHVEKEALQIAGFTVEEIHDLKKPTDGKVALAFLEWMKTCAEWTLAGQNPSFDRDFLQEAAHRYRIDWPLAHRTLDLHSIAWSHMLRRGIVPPLENKHSALDLERILSYVGISVKRGTAHNALEDAKLEAEAFSRLLKEANLLAEYRHMPIPWL